MPALLNCTSDEREEISLALKRLRQTVTENPFVPVVPTEPQAVFLTVPAKEVMYGGAAGGGKSIALLAGALQYVTESGYSALLLRRTFADLNLPDALIPLSHQWLRGTSAKWSEQKHEWTFPTGATLTFGYLETEADKYRYQGAAFQFIGFDELTQFTETQYRYLFSRLRRRESSDVPVRMRSATNPGGIGHEWVRRRFIDSGGPDRLFIPAMLEDNPYLDAQAYEASLAELDVVTRAQLRKGDWKIRAQGNLFRAEWFEGANENRIVDGIPPLVRIVRAWDLAATEEADGTDPDFTATCKMGTAQDGTFYVLDADEFRASPANVEVAMKATAKADGKGVEVFIEQEPGASGKIVIDHYRRTVLPGLAVYGVRSTGDKITRFKPFSAASENGLVRLLRGSWVGHWLDRLSAFGLQGTHDDLGDASAAAHSALTGGATEWEGEGFNAFDDTTAEPDKPPHQVMLERLRGKRDQPDGDWQAWG
jgi:predicted phage terminase large subunit-like protein